jgi:hypothetical protein
MRGATLIALHEVVQEFGYGGDTDYQQMIPGAGTGDIEQVTLGVIDLLQISVVADCLDALLQRNYLVVASHHGDGPKFQPLRQVHGAD